MNRIGAAAARFLVLLPGLVLALLLVRAFELVAGVRTATADMDASQLVAVALGFGALDLARFLPGLFLLSLPFLLRESGRARFSGLGMLWSAIVVVDVVLVQYFLTARTPLGADLFAYSWREIRDTVSAGARMDGATIAAFVLPLACLWGALGLLDSRVSSAPRQRTVAIVFALAVLALFAAPARPDATRFKTDDGYHLALDKLAFFVEDNVAYLLRRSATRSSTRDIAAVGRAPAKAANGLRYLDPAHPFVHAEQTPDLLGAYFSIRPEQPPNLVFIIVEGLGRAFSGPGAYLGSFTPYLDDLAGRSLYWENFLAVQGRTFAVLPSLFGSLPFGDNGLSALGEAMPAHDSLLSILKDQGYHLRFYSGFNLDFDNERAFLQRQGVHVMLGVDDFGPEYPYDPDPSSWGYPDGELVSLALANEARQTRQPFVAVIQMMTMHTPYKFPGRAHYHERVERRLDALGVTKTRKADYRMYRDIYAAIAYTDDALRRFFEESAKNPAYANTIFIVTGDHRLPEIPMSTRIDRFHVPLIIFSPLLKGPKRIKSMSSHFDVTPSLLALLAHNYGLRTPREVAWIGTGLDMAPYFRNIHDIPLKAAKRKPVDFVSGAWFFSDDTLYALSDGMGVEPVRNDAALADVKQAAERFRAANDRFARDHALFPGQAARPLATYRSQDRMAPAAAASRSARVELREVRSPEEARAGQLTVEAVFANTDTLPSAVFVPLVVVLSGDGRELSETYGAAMTLAPGQQASIRLQVKSAGIVPGRYFISVIPSHPETGKPVAAGRYRIPVRLL